MNKTLAKSMILITVIMMDVLTGMEFDLFVPSFPDLQTQFNLTPFWVEALLSINFVGYCLSLFFVGALADHYGRKPIILYGLITFIIGSTLCLWSASFHFMLLGRFLQGVGIAAPAILSFLIIADSYPIKKQQFLMAMLNGSMNAAAGAAPVIGSYLTMYFHWQGNFVALLLLGLLAFIMTLFFIPNYKLPEHKETLSLRGYFPIFRSKPLLLLIIYFICTFAPYWIFVGLSPLLYMQDLGVSLVYFGYYQGILAIAFAIGSVLFGLVIGKYAHSKTMYVTGQIFIISLIFMGFLTVLDSHSPFLITSAMLIFVIGQIIPSIILYPICLNFMPQAKGRVSAILQGGRLVFSSFFLQIAGYFYNGSFKNIGLMLSSFILIGLILQYFVVRNRDLMDFKGDEKI